MQAHHLYDWAIHYLGIPLIYDNSDPFLLALELGQLGGVPETPCKHASTSEWWIGT